MKILCSHASLRSFMEHLPEDFAAGKGEILYDKRNQVRKFTLPEPPAPGLSDTIIVKRFKRPNFFQTICYSTFWRNKAEKAYRYAQRLKEMGIDTPAPLGALTLKNGFGLVKQYYFASTEDSSESCWCLLKPDFQKKDILIVAFARYLVYLHEKGFLHGDTNISNFLWHTNQNGEYSFSVIDINRSKFLHRPASYEECIRNLFRLTHSQRLLEHIIREYAIIRHWDEDKTLRDVRNIQQQFVNKKMFLSRFKKKKFKIEQND